MIEISRNSYINVIDHLFIHCSLCCCICHVLVEIIELRCYHKFFIIWHKANESLLCLIMFHGESMSMFCLFSPSNQQFNARLKIQTCGFGFVYVFSVETWRNNHNERHKRVGREMSWKCFGIWNDFLAFKGFFAFAFETLRLQEPNIRKLTDYVALNCNKCSVVWNCKSLNVSKFLKDSSHATIKTTRYLWILCFEIFCTTEANKNNFGRETKILLK